MTEIIDLGEVSAYALAVKYGYEGTEEEWVRAQQYFHDESSKYATDAKNAAESAQESEELSEDARIASEAAQTKAEQAQLEAESWAHGGTGIREGEDVDSSKYWCQQSELHKNTSQLLLNDATEALQDINEKIVEMNKKIIDVSFEVTDDGDLMYDSEIYEFEINDDGDLEYWVKEEEL